MVRQVNLPTFFITLSAAEARWNELLKILKKLVDGVDATDDNIINMTYSEKCRLIRSDPVTCSRYFDYRLRELLKCLKNGVFGPYELTHYYWRIEFQHRGSPHAHGIYWLKGAPLLDTVNFANNREVENFIDQFITTIHCHHLPSLQPFMRYQIHTHRPAYCDRGDMKCRFNFPHPPLPATKILNPLADEITLMEKQRYKTMFENIKSFLRTNSTDRSLNEFDIQFINDPYACVCYIIIKSWNIIIAK